MKLFYLVLLLHFIADFTLQGILADLKQKSWWMAACNKFNVDYSKYQYDYICGLVCHSLYWTLFTFMPLLYLSNNIIFCSSLIVFNTLVHAIIDDIKANKHKINLVQDQLLHLVQIAITVFLYFK